MIRRLEHRRRKGVVMVMFTMMMLFIILPAVGLAVDAGVMFAIKGKMQSAADGAALSAARSLNRGQTFAAQQSAAEATAKKFYHINIENGWLGLNGQADPVVTFPVQAGQMMTIHVEATVTAPTYFMRVVGPSSLTLRSMAEVNRRFVNLILVMDRSTSLSLSNSCTPLKDAAADFTNAFMNGTDQLGLVTFGTTYRMDFALANDFLSRASPNNIPYLINRVSCAGYTNSASGYSLAAQTLINLGQPGALNVVVYFTDGQPTAIHLPKIPMIPPSGTKCTINGETPAANLRNGVVAAISGSSMGVSIANEPNVPGSVPSSDWLRPVDDTDADTAIVNPDNAGCTFRSNTAGSSLTTDTSHLTPGGSANFVDFFGNSLTGSLSVTTAGTGSSQYITVTSTNASTQIPRIAENAIANAGNRYRALSMLNDTKLVTFAVGLGNDGNPPNIDLLKRIANDPTSGFYNNSYPAGDTIYATASDQLQAAFSRLAAEVLRISM
jgi:Flp pilus assembly protein TadG